MYQLVQECKFGEPIARNAGAWFTYRGEIYRPAQDSAVRYGHKLVIQRVRREADGCFSFREVRRDTSPLKGWNWDFIPSICIKSYCCRLSGLSESAHRSGS